MKNKTIALSMILCLGMTAPAHAFSLSFQWGNLKKCTSGNPNRVNSPNFTVSSVPEGTKRIRFKMVDRNVPSYNHGGGTVNYTGGSKIPAGAFKYKSPCPPSGSHTYEWTATALSATGKKLGTAKARRNYP